MVEAFGHRSYVLLVLGFFTCGFQLAFVTVHLPSYLLDRGLGADIGAWTIAFIGLFNIVGSLGSGWLSSRMPKRYLLSIIYFSRALSIVAFILLPATTTSTLIFGAVTGLLWLSTVPPTSGLVALMFGTRWLTMLFGFAFFSHQVGGFLGVWLGGLAFEATGSYNLVWWLSVFFGVASAVINLPIVEKPVARPARGGRVTAAAMSTRLSVWRSPLVILIVRLPDRADQLRPALDVRVFPRADGRRERLGPRPVRPGAGDRDAAVGRRAAVLRRARRPLRRAIRARRRRAALHRRPRLDGVRRQPVRALYVGGRADRVWAAPVARSRLVIGAFAKLLPPQWRTIGFGAGTAAGSFGQFLFSPLAVGLIDNVGWQNTLLIFAAILLLLLPLAFVLSAPPTAAGLGGAPRSRARASSQALAEALGHRSYVLLMLGYFTCGFQLFFITVHLPAYLVDRGLPA